MNRRAFLRHTAMTGAGALAASLGCATRAMPSKTPPNFVFILIDDLGWADAGCFGSTFYETPNIDRLASEGMRFTNAYAACPVCSPTRASIMTGKYPARLHLTDFLKGKRSPEDAPVLTAPYKDQLDLEEVTIPEVLQTCEYTSCHIGKWHLGNPPYGPDGQGFDFNIGGSIAGAPNSYFWPEWEKRIPVEGAFEGEYLTDRLSLEACDFIESHQDVPFFLYLAHYSVHIPIQPRADLLAKYENKLIVDPPPPGAQANPHYAAMVEAVDESVGRVLATLDNLGLAENTVVVFFSDNGGLSVKEGQHTPATTNTPLRTGKGYLYEGGVREPCIVRWPDTVRPGTVCEAPVCSIDFFPTFCEAAGAKTFHYAGSGPVDGESMMPLWRGTTSTLDREALYWHYPHFSNQGGRPGGAIRAGDWKLIERYDYGDIELYNLADDPSETSNLSAEHPDIAATLKAKLAQWRIDVDATMPPPNPAYKA